MAAGSKLKESNVVERAIQFLHEPRGSTVRSITNYVTNVLGYSPGRAGNLVVTDLQHCVQSGRVVKEYTRYNLTGRRRQRTIESHRQTKQGHGSDCTRCPLPLATNKITKSTGRNLNNTRRSVRIRNIRSKMRSNITALLPGRDPKESSSSQGVRNVHDVTRGSTSEIFKGPKRKRKTMVRGLDDSNQLNAQSLNDVSSNTKSSRKSVRTTTSSELEVPLRKSRRIEMTTKRCIDNVAEVIASENGGGTSGVAALQKRGRHFKANNIKSLVDVTRNAASENKTIRDTRKKGKFNARSLPDVTKGRVLKDNRQLLEPKRHPKSKATKNKTSIRDTRKKGKFNARSLPDVTKGRVLKDNRQLLEPKRHPTSKATSLQDSIKSRKADQ